MLQICIGCVHMVTVYVDILWLWFYVDLHTHMVKERGSTYDYVIQLNSNEPPLIGFAQIRVGAMVVMSVNICTFNEQCG